MLKNKKILITGGTGFVGSHLVEYWLDREVTQLFVTQHSDQESFVSSLLPKDHIFTVDLTDSVSTAALFSSVRPDYIIHLASYTITGDSFAKSEHILSQNVSIQLSVLEAMRLVVPHSRLLSVGSAEQYGMSIHPDELPIREDHVFRPINPYGVSKITQEMLTYAHSIAYGLDIVSARPFNHTGVRQAAHFFVPALAERIVAVERGAASIVMVGNLEARRDISNVRDIVRAYEVLLLHGKTGEVYNVGSGKSVAMQTVFDIMSKLSLVPIRSELNQDLLRPSDIADSYAAIEKISKLGWKPSIPLEDTLEQVLQEKRNSRTVQ